MREIWNLGTKQKAGSVTGIVIDSWGGIGALSPDGQYFAASLGRQKKNSIGVFPAKGKPLGELDAGGDGGGVAALFFASPERLVALNSNGTARVWKLPSGDLEHELQLGEAREPYHIAVSPGGNYLAATTGKSTLQIFDLNTAEVAGEQHLPSENQFYNVRSDAMAFSPDGQELAVVADGLGSKMTFLKYNVADGKLLAKADLSFANGQRPQANQVKTHRLDWFPDRSKLLYRGHHVLDAKLGGPVWNAPEEDGSSDAPRKLLDGTRILIAYGGRQNPGLKVAPIPLDSIEAAAKVVAEGGEASDAGMPTISKADYDGMATIAPVATNWTMQLDPAPANNTIKNSISLPKERPSIGGLVISRPSVNRAIIWYSDDSLSVMQGKGLMRFGINLPEDQKGTSFIEAYDLAKGGKAVATLAIPYKSAVLDASLDGEHIAVKTTKPNDERVDVYNLMTGKHIAGLRPFQQKDDFFKGVTTAVMLDGQYLLTQNFNGTSTYMWKLPECKAIWQMKGAKNFSVSPGGKYLGFLAESRYLFMDPRTGELVGELPVTMPNIACAFHPMGTHLAILASDTISRKISIVDVATGKLTADFHAPQGNDTIQWCGDAHVLVDNMWLVDLKQMKNGWRYLTEFTAHARTQPDGRHWYVGSTSPQDPSITLSCAVLPEKMVADKINAAELPDESLLKPGMQLNLSVNLTAAMPPDRPNLAQEVGTWFEAGLKKHGFQVGAGAPYTFTVTTSQSNTGRNMEFRSFGLGRGGNSSVPVVEVKTEVALVSNGQALWKHTQTFSNATFGIVHLRDNEDVTSHLAKQMWAQVSERLTKFPVPSQVFGATAGAGLGQSKFTTGGVQPLSGR